jgi:hypothetical protein
MADTKISALTAVSSVVGAQEFAVNDAGTSKKATATQIAAFIAPAATNTVSGILETAAKADQEAGTGVSMAVTPASQAYHPSAAKFWAYANGGATPVLAAGYNVTSIGDTGTGRMTITFANDFSSAFWCVVGAGQGGTTNVTNAAVQWTISKAAGSIEVNNGDLSATPVIEDPQTNTTGGYNLAGFGTLA